MPFTVTPTALSGALILEPKAFGDPRGFFYESFNARDFAAAVGREVVFVQDNHSRSVRGVLRGLHFQNPHPQGKLVRVALGEVYDVAVDMRRSSAKFGHWVGVMLSAENRRQLWVPEGFAHGFLVLSEVAEFLYKTTDFYHPECEQTLRWDDPALGIAWPLTQEPQLAIKDQTGKRLTECVGFA
jgi:dTDP-4-dehydrorhamnose 3,5-epimerase